MPAKANVIADAVVTRLQTINGTPPWMTAPKQVKRGLLVGTVMGELPAMVVEVGNWQGVMANIGLELSTEARIWVHCISGDAAEPLAEAVLNDMVQDAIRALRQDNTFGGLCHHSCLAPAYRKPDVEAAQRSARGIATLDVDFYWENSLSIV